MLVLSFWIRPLDVYFIAVSHVLEGRALAFFTITPNLVKLRSVVIVLDRSPSNRFGGYRDAWLPVVLSDAAAFQQYLSTFALHLQRADPPHSAELKVPMLMLHSQALQAVNRRLRSPEVGTDKGLLAAVISFIAHYVCSHSNK